MDMQTGDYIGGPLAAVYQAQQQSADIGAKNLSNLVKGMQMPIEALKGQEAAMLMQDPNYLKQKTANTLIELSNQYDASQFQQTLNAANRVRIQLDAAGGDKAKEQQIVANALQAMKMDPNSEFGQYAMRDPRGALDKFIQGTEVAMSRSAKQIGAEKLEGMKDAAALERTKYQADATLKGHQLSAGATIRAAEIGAQYKDIAQLGSAISEASKFAQSLQTQITKLTTEEGKNEAINNLIASSGLTKEQATSAVNSGKYKESLQADLKEIKRQYEHLKQQSPYYKGFNFGKQITPESQGGGNTQRRSLDSFDPNVKPTKPTQTVTQQEPVTGTVQPQQPETVVRPNVIEQPQVNPVNSPLQNLFGSSKPITSTTIDPNTLGYLNKNIQPSSRYDRTEQRKQAQIDTLKRQEAEAILEVTKWENRKMNTPYAKEQMQNAIQNLEDIRSKLSTIM